MRKFSHRHGREIAVLLLSLGFASAVQARNIVEIPSSMYFTEDEVAGINLPTPDPRLRENASLLFPVELVRDENGDLVLDTDGRPKAFVHQDDFLESSLEHFGNLGQRLKMEANKPRIRPFLAAWVYDVEEETFTVADRALGPMLAERPHTLGKGKFSLGLSYQQIKWDRLDGRTLSGGFSDDPDETVAAPVFDPTKQLDFRSAHQDINGDGRLTGQETDFLAVNVGMKLVSRFIDVFVEYGLTNDIDLGIALPIAYTEIEIKADAAITQDPRVIAAFGDPTFDPNAPENADLLEPGLLLGAGGSWAVSINPFQPVNSLLNSRRNHFFCRRNEVSGLDTTFVPIEGTPPTQAATGKTNTCPGGDNGTPRGDLSSGTHSGAKDVKRERAVGIGDMRFRFKWHALHGDKFIPDLAWVSELRAPSGRESDLQGTGAIAATNYLVGSWTLGPVRPHFNIGVELSGGPSWQDSTEWVFGFEWLLAEWLSVSFEQMGRVPFGNEVARRYEYGGGFKVVPTPGMALMFDFIKPINENEGLTSDFIWRVGGQIQF